jgi:hypothetical protein
MLRLCSPVFSRGLRAAVRAVLAASVVLASVGWTATGAQAASEGTATVEVEIVDGKTRSPLDNAQATLFGPQAVVRLTDAGGTTRFENVAPGTYEVRARREGYLEGRSARFDVRGGETTRVTVELPAVLKEIGHVTAAPRVTVRTIDDASAVRRVSDTLSDALQNIAGVSMQLDGSSISLRGHDPSQTGFKIDGLMMAGGISGAALNAGLFSGATVEFDQNMRGVAGSVNYQTVNATQAWSEKIVASYGSYDRASYQLLATGTSGKLGIAVQHGGRSSRAPISGMSFADASGLDYVHDGANHGDGDVLKLAWSFDKNTTVGLSAMRAQSTVNDVCTDDTTNVPCGYGPGVNKNNDFHFFGLRAQSLIGAVAVNAVAYSNLNSEVYDGNRLHVAGIPQPYWSQRVWRYGGVNLLGTATAGRHTLTASYSGYHGSNDSIQRFDGADFSSSADVDGYQTGLSDAFSASTHLKLTAGAMLTKATGLGHGFIGSLRADWKMSAFDSAWFSAASGASSPNFGAVTTYSDPHKAQIDCHGRSVFVQGPSQDPVAQHNLDLQLGLRHRWKRGDLSISAYRTDSLGTSFGGALQLAEAASVVALPPNYLHELEQTWSTASNCAPAPFDPGRVFAYEMLSDVGQRYVGISTDGNIQLGRATAAFWSYGVTSASISSIGSRVAALGFIFPPGRQIPGRPLQNGSLTISLRQPRGQLEYIGSVRFVGTANPQNIAPFTVVNTGVVAGLRYGTLSLLAGNVFNNQSGLFTTYRGINPFTLRDGTSIAFPSTPLAPRQLTLRYSAKVGR